jgi:hypothetical protein
MAESSKLKDMLSGIKTTTSNPKDFIALDPRQVTSELEDITYFIEQAKKYRTKQTVMRASMACQALGAYLESLANEE